MQAPSTALSYSQQALWFIYREAQKSAAYNMVLPLRFAGDVDGQLLQQAVQRLVERHSMLRSRFSELDGVPYQYAVSDINDYWQDVNAAPWTEHTLRAKLHHYSQQPFVLEQGVFRATLFHGAKTGTVLLLNLHHIAGDAASLAILGKELLAIYAAEDVPPMAINYGDYVRWEAELLNSKKGQRLAAYWQQRLAGEVPVLQLPADYPRPALQTFNGSSVRVELPEPLSAAIKDLAKAHKSTLFTVLFSAYQILLHRYSGQDDIWVGIPTSTPRNQTEFADMVGYLVNPMILRGEFAKNDELSFSGLLQLNGKQILTGLYHQPYPFTQLIEQLQPQRNPAYPPLVQALFALERDELIPKTFSANGLIAQRLELAQMEGQFDLTLTFSDSDDGKRLSAAWAYNTDLFKEATIARMAEHLQSLLQSAVNDAEQNIAAMPLLTDREQAQLQQWNQTEADYPKDKTIIDLFELQVDTTPDNLAVVFDGQSLSYRQLNDKANQLARYLLSLKTETGTALLADNPLIAIAVERSPDMVVGLLGILKAGGAYLPIDPDYPAARIRYMLDDSQAPLLLTQSRIKAQLSLDEPEHQRVVLCLDELDVNGLSTENLKGTSGPEDLAYVIYTSGSTGNPKGVMIKHCNLFNSTQARQAYYRSDAETRLLLLPSFAFDAFAAGAFLTLNNGGTLHLTRHVSDIDKLAAIITNYKISHLICTPAHYQEILNQNDELFDSLHSVIFGGEVASHALLQQHFAKKPQAALFNEYGPTEATIWSSVFRYQTGSDATNIIGRPIVNARIYVLDALHQLQAPGIAGELCIAGAGLSPGYLNRPELSAEKFIEVALFGKTERIYKTGDLARWLPDGNLEFLGRIDRQIKLRGFRIELGEIEAALSQHPGVKEAVANLYEADGDKHIVAYLTVDDGNLAIDELRSRLKAGLPDYMVPSYFVVLDSLPLTPNGKIDRKALPAPEFQASTGFSRPATPSEDLLAALWSGVLKRESIGRHDNFFELGGHSLLATQLVARIRESFQVELPIRAVFEHPELSGLATAIEAAAGNIRLPAIEPQAADASKVLSFAQQRLWFLNQFEGNDTATYNMPLALRLSGQLNVEALQQSLQCLVERHSGLRSCFPNQSGQAQLQIRAIEALRIQDLRALAADKQEHEVQGLANAHAIAPFDLGQGPLFKADLLRLDDTDAVLLLNMHHIISDGWSMGVFMRDWQQAYTAFAVGDTPSLPELAIEYSDYAAWQRQWFRGEVLQQQIDYWTGQLKGLPELLELPTDKQRPPKQSYQGAHITHTLPATLGQAVTQLSRQQGVTVFMTLLAAFKVLLSRYSRQQDICVGSPIANRTHAHTEDLIGFFVNTLILRSQVEPQHSFIELLQATRQTCLAAYAHQDIPFEMLVETLQPTRSLSHSPLFQVMFVLQNNEAAELALPDVEVSVLEAEYPIAKFDLTLNVAEQDGQLQCYWEYATDLFTDGTIGRMAGHFEVLLNAIVNNPEQTIGLLPLLTEQEARQLQAWNDTATGYPKDQTIAGLFERQVETTPDNIAVAFEDRQLTYRELNQQANQLAHYLLGLKTGNGQLLSGNCLVGICVERSLDMIVGLLAILKAGAAYVPLDPDYPAQRLQFILEDADVPVLLAQSRLLERLPESTAKVVCMDKEREAIADCSGENPAQQSGPDDLAYIIYTSGSTGKPKGCQLTHANVTRLFSATDDWYRFNAQDVWTLFHSYAFDFSVWEIWGALFYGGKLVVVPYHTSRNPSLFYQLLIEQGVTVLNQTPSAFRQLQDVDSQPDKLCLRLVIFGGEALDFTALQPWFSRHGDSRPQLINMYGITETTVHVTYYPVAAGDNHGKSIIGKPIPDLQVWVVDALNNPLPIGVPGEMLVGGAGVARGYLNRAELTAERFIDIELFGQRQRVYKSGDLARWLPDGNIEYLGRIDNQVKIRGFRIELGEIEACLTANPAVKEAVVLASGEGEAKALVAYVSANSALKVEELRAGLNALLPAYMVPAYFVQLDALPLLPNGKINRKSLTGLKPIESSREFRPPQNELESELLSIWQKHLETDDISTNANFFEVGGNSLSLVRVHWEIKKNHPETTLMDLFAHPNIADLALFLSGGNKARMAIETLPLDKKYFSTGDGGLLEYSLDEALAAQLNGRENLDVQDILRASFGYLLFELSEQKEVPYYAALNGQHIIALRHDFEAIDSIEELLLASRSQFLNPEQIHPLDSFLNTGANPGSREVLPLYSDSVSSDFDNADLHWHTDTHNGAVNIAFRFSPRMDREEMQQLPGLYAAILEEIIKEC